MYHTVVQQNHRDPYRACVLYATYIIQYDTYIITVLVCTAVRLSLRRTGWFRVCSSVRPHPSQEKKSAARMPLIPRRTCLFYLSVQVATCSVYKTSCPFVISIKFSSPVSVVLMDEAVFFSFFRNNGLRGRVAPARVKLLYNYSSTM